MLLKVLLIASLFFFKNADSAEKPIKAKDGDFPFMVAVLENGEFVCSGSIIDSRWVLTAAHCVLGVFSEYTVLAGTIDTSSGDIYNLSQIFRRGLFLHNVHDIALLKIKGHFILSNQISPIEISTLKEIPEESNFLTVVWEFPENKVKSRKMSFGEVKGVKKCKGKQYICTSKTAKNLCLTDSAGPLLNDNSLVGIVSSLVVDGDCEQGAIFMRVEYYTNWIEYVQSNEPATIRLLIDEIREILNMILNPIKRIIKNWTGIEIGFEF